MLNIEGKTSYMYNVSESALNDLQKLNYSITENGNFVSAYIHYAPIQVRHALVLYDVCISLRKKFLVTSQTHTYRVQSLKYRYEVPIIHQR